MPWITEIFINNAWFKHLNFSFPSQKICYLHLCMRETQQLALSNYSAQLWRYCLHDLKYSPFIDFVKFAFCHCWTLLLLMWCKVSRYWLKNNLDKLCLFFHSNCVGTSTKLVFFGGMKTRAWFQKLVFLQKLVPM